MFELDSTDTAWVYTVVPVNYNLNGLTYTIIDTCCIPDDGDALMENIEAHSLLLTGNIPKDSPRISGCPNGRLQVKNTNASTYEGVRKVRVIMNTLVKVRSVYTDVNGNYSCSTRFYTNVAYTINYRNSYGFHIWYNLYCLFPATHYMGVHSPSGYYANLNNNTLTAWYLSTINNAAHIYYTTIVPHYNLSLPFGDMRILAWGNSSLGNGSTPLLHHRLFAPAFVDSLAYYFFPGNIPSAVYMHYKVLPDMVIAWRTYSTDEIYNIVFHELSHASHYMKLGNTFWTSLIIGTLRLSLEPGYGNGLSFNAQYVGVAEMWAFWAGYKAEKYYWETYFPTAGVTPSITYSGGWFHPEVLDALCNNVEYYNNMGTILNTYSPLSINTCAVKGALVLNAPNYYNNLINNILNPICSTSF